MERMLQGGDYFKKIEQIDKKIEALEQEIYSLEDELCQYTEREKSGGDLSFEEDLEVKVLEKIIKQKKHEITEYRTKINSLLKKNNNSFNLN